MFHPGLTTVVAKDPDASYPPIRDVRPPSDPPNVLVILIDADHYIDPDERFRVAMARQ